MDGTKIAANASRHAAVSHGRAGGMIEERAGFRGEDGAPPHSRRPAGATRPGDAATRPSRRRCGVRHRLRTASGRAADKKRKETVEPFFGIVKAAMGFRKFLLRGLRKVNLEWTLVRLAYNVRRLATVLAAKPGPDCAPMTPRTA